MPSPEKEALPYVVVRVDVEAFTPADPGWAVRVLSVFDDEESARAEVRRLQELNADKSGVYLLQRDLLPPPVASVVVPQTTGTSSVRAADPPLAATGTSKPGPGGGGRGREEPRGHAPRLAVRLVRLEEGPGRSGDREPPRPGPAAAADVGAVTRVRVWWADHSVFR